MSHTTFLLAIIAILFASAPSSVVSFPVHQLGAAPIAELANVATEPKFNSSSWLGAMFNNLTSASLDEILDRSNIPTQPRRAHSMKTKQNSFGQFTMDLMCSNAPWSSRIQPALLYQRKETRYTQWATNVTVSQGAPWLILYEGSLTVNQSNVYRNENDVWASGDFGRTWDLMAGISRFGRSGLVESKYPNTFDARGGANNCEDPASDYVFSIGGYRNDGLQYIGTNSVWYSTDGLTWNQQNAAYRFGPSRYFSSCDVDESGHIYSMGGFVMDNNYPSGQLLNDIWQSSIVSGLREWKRMTVNAPWSARAEHLVLIGNSPVLQKELIYVIGGQVSNTNSPIPTAYATANDVWVSSDGAQTWVNLVANGEADFPSRWGHGGVITEAGVLLMFGGSYSTNGNYEGMLSRYDMWASFDGGIEWIQCVIDSGYAANPYFSTEVGVTLTDNEELLIAAGYRYMPGGFRPSSRDVWKTSFSLSDPQKLADMCATDLPPAGVGLTKWPRPVVQNSFAMTVQTRRAPWSARIQPAILAMATPISYVQHGTKLRISTPPNWLLMYEGSLTYGFGTEFQSNENDVWASADNGQSWDLISGITRNGTNGLAYSTSPMSSFSDRGASANCEDPTNDDVFSMGGYAADPYGGDVNVMSNEVWMSTDAIHWSLRAGGENPAAGSFLPRYFSQCVIDNSHSIILAGGQHDSVFLTTLFNDVWIGTNGGRAWRLITGRAPWTARSEHVMLLSNSQALSKTVLYVMGGFTNTIDGSYMTTNDVWVSSDNGLGWARVTDRAPWIKRWGHAGAVTRDGALVVIGGSDSLTGFYNDMQTWRDGWVSLDGGYTWFQLTLSGDISYIRGEQGVTLTADERLILVSGYSYSLGAPRTDYADLWISNITFSNVNSIIRVSESGASVPSGGVGLRVWPGTSPVVEIFTPLVIAAIAGGGALLLLIMGYCVYRKRGGGGLPSVSMPAFLSPRSSRRSAAEVSNGDYFTQQSVRDDKYSFSDSSSLSDHYQPPTGGYQPPGAYQPPASHHGHNGDSHGLLS